MIGQLLYIVADVVIFAMVPIVFAMIAGLYYMAYKLIKELIKDFFK